MGLWFRFRQMPAGDIAEGQRGPERDAGARIVPAHDARHVVAGGVKPVNGAAVGIERAGMLVGPDAGIGAEIADHELDRIEGRAFERRDAGIGAVQRVALVAVVGARSLAEIGIAAFGCGLVELRRPSPPGRLASMPA